MLEQLAKKQDKWIKMALSLCQDVDQANDIVQEMYIKMYDISQKNPETKIRDVYVWVVMLNILKSGDMNFGDGVSNKSYCIQENKYIKVPIEDALYIAVQDNVFEIDDTDLMYLNRANDIRHLYRRVLEDNYDKSLRQIADDLGISHFPIHSYLKKARKLILRDKYEKLYENKRLKYKK